MSFRQIIDKLNGISLGQERSVFLQELKDADKTAQEALKSDNFGRWENGMGLRISADLTILRDTLLMKAMEYCGGLPKGLALLAVGGYGRGEMSPYSDVDILILHRDDNLPTEFINQFLYILWDIGLKLGNSVRSIKNVVSHSREDITLLTSLFESRLLSGDSKLVDEMYKAITNVLNGFREEYFKTKLEDIYNIYRKVGTTVLLKEPMRGNDHSLFFRRRDRFFGKTKRIRLPVLNFNNIECPCFACKDIDLPGSTSEISRKNAIPPLSIIHCGNIFTDASDCFLIDHTNKKGA